MVANDKYADQFDVIWILDENWSDEKNKWVQGSVTVQPSEVADDFEYKVVVQADKGNNNQSYIAFDEVMFFNEKGNCDIQPSAAKPTDSPPTVPPTTVSPTPAPTEPPGRKLFSIFGQVQSYEILIIFKNFQPSLCVILKLIYVSGKLNQATTLL